MFFKTCVSKSFSQIYILSDGEKDTFGETVEHRGYEQGLGFESLSHHVLTVWQRRSHLPLRLRHFRNGEHEATSQG